MNGFHLTKFYKKYKPATLQTFTAAEKKCLDNDGILPVTYSVQETMSTMSALGLGATIPMGLKVVDFDSSTERRQLIWTNGLKADYGIPKEMVLGSMAECAGYFPTLADRLNDPVIILLAYNGINYFNWISNIS